MSSQSAPEYTAVIPHGNTYVASDILLTLDCSGYICGCHLLHALCNHPFYKPLHPPEPSALPPSSPTFGEGKGEALYRIHGGYSNADPGAVALVLSQNAPEYTIQSLMIIRMSQATSSSRSIARTTYAVVICFMHFATTPSTNLSIPLSLRLFPLPLRPSEKARGRVYTVFTGETRMLIQAQLHLCLRKMHPNIRHNPS